MSWELFKGNHPLILPKKCLAIKINASTTFKERYKNHKHNIDNAASKGTALSSHIWKLKNQNINFDLKFSILKLCKVYSRESKSCDLCLTEKTIIMFSNHYLTTNHTDHFSTLNKRSEILQKCRHRAKHTLEQWWVFFGMHRNIITSLIN